jgi:hypothetical protein
MELFFLASNILLVSVQTRIEADGKGRPFEDGLRSEGEKMFIGWNISFSFGVSKYPFLRI